MGLIRDRGLIVGGGGSLFQIMNKNLKKKELYPLRYYASQLTKAEQFMDHVSQIVSFLCINNNYW